MSPAIHALVSQDQGKRFLHIQRTTFRFFLGDGGAERVREGERGLVAEKEGQRFYPAAQYQERDSPSLEGLLFP